jgi:uncharacterized protein (UPF0276 family)
MISWSRPPGRVWSGCGRISHLNLTKLHINAHNHGFDARAYLDRLPLDRVAQFHVIGYERRDGRLRDTHARPTPPEILQLARAVSPCCPPAAWILEWDRRFPEFEELMVEVGAVRRAPPPRPGA